MNADTPMGEFLDYDMGSLSMTSSNDASFMTQLQLAQAAPAAFAANTNGSPVFSASEASYDAHKNRNRGNYRCSKCGEPKKGHICPLVPANYKCNRCGLQKKACTCGAPDVRSVAVQVEMDEDMTLRVLDLSVQGFTEFQQPIGGFPSPPMT